MTGAWEAGFEQIRPAPSRRGPPEDPREALQAAIWEALRGLQMRTGGRPRNVVAADLMAICDQAAAAERERFAARLAELHKPHRIYDECEHQHAYDSDEERERDGVIDCGDFLSCEGGYMCTVCRECCVDEGQTEACADGHRHGRDLPICSTAAIVAGLLGDQP